MKFRKSEWVQDRVRGDQVIRPGGAVISVFRAEQPIKMGLFIIVPRENDAFGEY